MTDLTPQETFLAAVDRGDRASPRIGGPVSSKLYPCTLYPRLLGGLASFPTALMAEQLFA